MYVIEKLDEEFKLDVFKCFGVPWEDAELQKLHSLQGVSIFPSAHFRWHQENSGWVMASFPPAEGGFRSHWEKSGQNTTSETQ